ncbi:MAG TPA: hypothetical protein DCG19_08740 [Cryomorphaceae bacterium]|nr:hypothetical protein [Owenweeksia sp.]MBF98718.1 hypothetical protein [Owenweeksia sp.]HAD97480.1 hypothetical protein [Cryomorphaceae bacterium]HBF19621.1 hypothetical protein [Cryomorphaceae bacterium]|tara:strand:- start:3707 stop:4309 length:603 start_codon:yes stop_codon:yes gene_type:complete
MINPRNIHCLALNYKGVGANDQVPLYFVKSLSALCFTGAEVPYPSNSESMWTEVELGIVISKPCENVSEEGARDYIKGFTVCADITCSNLHGRDHHLGFSKSRYNFCPVLDVCLEMDLEALPDLKLETSINGKLTQSGYLRDMIYDTAKSVSFVSQITRLEEGDIILTGTPSGVENNIIKAGDQVVQTIENIGSLEYSIV